MTDIPDVYICLICKTPIEWEGTDDHRGSIWSCEKCGETFCRQCFIDAHDAEAFRSMVNNDDVVTCPHCYGEAHNRKISSRMQIEELPRSLILEALKAKKTGACKTQWLQGENLRALLMQLRNTILSPHVETKMESGRYFELYKQRKSAPEIVVTLYGGLIQAVHSTNPYTKVYIADSDILENDPGDDEVAALDYAQKSQKHGRYARCVLRKQGGLSLKSTSKTYTAVIINWLDPDCTPWISAFISQEKRDDFIRVAKERIALADKADELCVYGDSGILDDTDYLNHLPAPVYLAKLEPWLLTDDATMQHVRKLGPDTYELVQYGLLNPEMELYGVFSDTVHLPDYPADETLMILKTFGYSTLSDVQQEYGEEAYRQIIAECIFEHYLPLRDEPIYHGTEEDVVSFIKEITEEKTDV